jgi:uncharacterized membrane protein
VKTRVAVLGLSFIGMVETLYLSLAPDSGPVPCHITNGCGDVLTSVYSEIGGVPISWLGLAFYLTAFAATVFDLFGGISAFRYLRWPATAAFVVSLVLTGIQAFVLEAYCEYCLTSAVLSTSICALTWAGSRPGPEETSSGDGLNTTGRFGDDDRDRLAGGVESGSA